MKSNRKYSVFCEKRYNGQDLAPAAVLIPTDDGNNKIWVLVKGKIYKNGWYRYWHNGKEGKARPYHWIDLRKKPQEEIEGIVRKFNMQILQRKNPNQLSKKIGNIFNSIDSHVERILSSNRNRRIIRLDPYPVEPPHTVVLGVEGTFNSDGIATMNIPTRDGQPVGEDTATI